MTENSKPLVNKYISEDKLQEQIRHLEQIAKKVNGCNLSDYYIKNILLKKQLTYYEFH